MKMQCNLLDGMFNDKSTTISVADLIKTMAGGNAAHRAGALEFALRNGRLRGGVSPGPQRQINSELAKYFLYATSQTM